LLPPGVRSATTLIPGQARAARRCSPGVLALQSFLHHGSGFGLSRRPTRGAKPRPREPPGAQPSRLHFRDPDSDAWAREPRIRRSKESIELRGPPSGGDPAHQAPLERFRAPVASPVSHPAGRVGTERLARAPSRRHPAPPCPSRSFAPEGATERWTSKTRIVEPSTSPTPCEAGWRPSPSRSSICRPLPACASYRIDPVTAGFRHRLRRWTRPFARSRSVVGPPVARWTSSHGISSLVDPARRCERERRCWASAQSLYGVRENPLRVTPTAASPRT
jgi:hypothetical protein